MYNFSTEPKDLERLNDREKWYGEFIGAGREIDLRNQDLVGTFRVGRPEHLVAAKLTRNSPKDQFDVHALLDTMYESGIDFDFKEIKKILDCEYTDRYEHFYNGRLNRQAELDHVRGLNQS